MITEILLTEIKKTALSRVQPAMLMYRSGVCTNYYLSTRI